MENSTAIAPLLLANASSIATNVVMFVAFIGLVTAGIMKGVKDWREFKKPEAAGTGPTAQIAAMTILENVTLSEWSRSNRDVIVAIRDLIDVMSKHRDEVHEQRLETADLRHAIAGLERSLSRGDR